MTPSSSCRPARPAALLSLAAGLLVAVAAWAPPALAQRPAPPAGALAPPVVAVAPEPVQRGAAPTLRVVERTEGHVTYEFTARWRGSLADAAADPGRTVLAAVAGLPLLSERVALRGLLAPAVTVLAAEYDEVPLPLDAEAAEGFGLVGPPAEVVAVGLERRQPAGTLLVRALHADPEAGTLRRYTRLRIRVALPEAPAARGADAPPNPHLSVTRSALAEGTWFKIPIEQEGVYRVDRALIARLGLDPDRVDPARVLVFSNAGAPLPARNRDPRIPDLAERPRLVVGGGDGRFDAADGVYFFANGPYGWRWDQVAANNGQPGWRHYINVFSHVNYVFLRVDGVGGRDFETVAGPAAGGPLIERVTGRVFKEEDRPEGMVDRDGPADRAGSGLDWLGRNATPSRPLIRAVLDTLPPDLAPGVVRYRARAAAANQQANPRLEFLRGQQVLSTTVINRISNPSRVFFYALESRFQEEVTAGTRLALDLRLDATVPGSPTGWIDYVQAFYPQDLRASDGYLRFVTPGGQAGPHEFALSGFAAEPEVWDVTEPGAERRLAATADGARWRVRVAAPNPLAPREIVAFAPTSPRVRRLDGARAAAVPNQNLHGITAHPDYVIVTPAAFRAAADRLAARRAADGLNPLVVDIAEVHNEFGGGIPDPRALRDFFRFLYDRATGEEPTLRMALLFGSGHYDSRGIRDERRGGFTPNWIPTYQTRNSNEYGTSFTSDDYFALLDPDEGIWADGAGGAERIDIGIGRLPVHTPQEADAAVRKIERYEDASTLGAWRTRYTVLADDHLPNWWDTDYHVQNSEVVADTVQARFPGINVDKIYMAMYPLQQTAVGARYPAATADAIRSLEEGRLVWNYAGHGNPYLLADERLITREQIAALNNIDRLTIAVTATCSFGRFDLAGEHSAGEEFVVNANGGAVAIFTTVREVFVSTNPEELNLGLNVALNRYLLTPDAEGRPRRLGEAYLLTKNTTAGAQANNRKFNLLGDPGLRIGLPERAVRVTSVNGVSLPGAAPPAAGRAPLAAAALPAVETPEGGAQARGEGVPEFRAQELAVIRGQVLRPDGGPDGAFQGEVDVAVYDVERTYTLPPQVPRVNTDGTFRQRTDVLWRGRASVRDGEWEARFIVPRDVSYAGRAARVSAYVVGASGLDGQGHTEAVRISTEAGAPLDDREGPRIRLFMNDTTFVSGGLTSNAPVLIARLEDASGINVAGAGVGHEMRLVINGDQANAIDVGAYYQSDLDTYQRGTVRFPMPDLPGGPHTVSLTAWDVVNNAATASVDFLVEDAERLRIAHAYPYPNPTTGPTRFVFEHNQAPGTPARVQIRIYTLSGRPVRTLDGPETLPDGTLSGSPIQIPWDGRDEDLDALATGIYLYKVRVEVDRGDGERRVAEEVQRLAIIR